VSEMQRDLVGIDDAMAAVMFKGDAKVESVRAVEVPGAAGGWLIEGDDGQPSGRRGWHCS
jgi:hypothetical protein